MTLLYVPAGLLLLDFVLLNMRSAQWVDTQDVEWLAPHSAAEGFFYNFFYTVSGAAYAVAFVPLLFGAYLVFRTLTRNYQQSGRRVYAAIAGNPWLVLFAITLALYFVSPFKLIGWHFVNARFVPYVILFATAGLSVSGYRIRRAAVITTAAAALAIYALVAINIRQANRALDDYVSGVDKIRANSVMLPLVFDTLEVGQISVVARGYEYYPIFRGGANGKGIAQFNTLTPMVYRSYPTSQVFPSWHASRSSDLSDVSRVYDYVLVWGQDADSDRLLRDAAFDLVHEQGKLRVFENRLRKPPQRADVHE
jgi:hypothetical protein